MQIDTTPQKAPERKLDAVDTEWAEMNARNERERAALTKDETSHQDLPLAYNPDGTLSFFWFDAHEEAQGAELYLFGKVW